MDRQTDNLMWDKDWLSSLRGRIIKLLVCIEERLGYRSTLALCRGLLRATGSVAKGRLGAKHCQRAEEARFVIYVFI